MGLSRSRVRLHRWVLLAAAWATPTVAMVEEDGSTCRPSPYYVQHTLASDGAVPAATVEPQLAQPWGLAAAPTGPYWVANHAAEVSTVHDGRGRPQPLVVTRTPGHPTALAYNPSLGFILRHKGRSGTARFLFATQGGVLAGWAPDVDSSQALPVVDHSAEQAAYTGLALAAHGTGFHLYAADFAHARVDVFDEGFNPVQLAGGFMDPQLPPGYAPFGIHALQGQLYITYAQQSAEDPRQVESGQGQGFVTVYDTSGRLLRRLAARGALNAPWAVALAPAGFGAYSHHLLVGNWGDGSVQAYEPVSGEWAGPLRQEDGQVLRLEGLRALSFGNGVLYQSAGALFFTAASEQGGRFGRLEPAPCVQPGEVLAEEAGEEVAVEQWAPPEPTSEPVPASEPQLPGEAGTEPWPPEP